MSVQSDRKAIEARLEWRRSKDRRRKKLTCCYSRKTCTHCGDCKILRKDFEDVYGRKPE